ncbi:leucine dehydrogenase [cyanobacterium TDX16]|nr:leucine dehydrogenase [cyanobacterium TDX16]
MKLFETVKEMGHEQVLFFQDKELNFKAIIALHDTSLGRAMGATRLFPYASEEDALQDVLRLSRGMTYKAACANIPVGGGKAVIIANPDQKTDKMLRAYGRFVDSLQGRFITGQDVNICPEDVQEMRRETRYVVGLTGKAGGPAPATALGVFLGIQAAVFFQFNKQDLNGLQVAVQGLGNVGGKLCDYLHRRGVKLFVTDLNHNRAEEIKQLYGATVVEPEDIYSLDVDIFAPCAMGAILNSETIPLIQASIIAGCANNQLQDENIHSAMLKSKGILYCPDYVINSGGLINVYHELTFSDEASYLKQIHSIYDTLLEIFTKSKVENITTQDASKRLAEERILKARKLAIAA